MSKQPTLNLFPIRGINLYQLPEQLRRLFPDHSANEEDCIPVSEQEVPVKQVQHIKPRLSVVK